MRWKALATVRAEDSVDWLLDLAPEVATRIGADGSKETIKAAGADQLRSTPVRGATGKQELITNRPASAYRRQVRHRDRRVVRA
jgi:hypothetical protein